MAISFWVLLGSAIGGLARYWVGVWVAGWAGTGFPWGTLLINVLGSFVIGLVAAGVAERGWSVPPVDLRAFVMAGMCGGFTTFSAFSLQTLDLLQTGRYGAALAYMLGSVTACITVVWLGWMMGRS